MSTTVNLRYITGWREPILLNSAYESLGTVEIILKKYQNHAGQVTNEAINLDSYSCLQIHIPLCKLSRPRELRNDYIFNVLSCHNYEREVCNCLAPRIADYCADFFTRDCFDGFFIRAEVDVSCVEVVVDDDEEDMMELSMIMDGVDVVRKMGVSKSVIEKLKKERRVNGSGELGTCMVCLEELSGVVELTKMPCSHLFHELCICRWLEEKNSCPICRCEVEDDY